MKSVNLNFLEPFGPLQACNAISTLNPLSPTHASLHLNMKNGISYIYVFFIILKQVVHIFTIMMIL